MILYIKVITGKNQGRSRYEAVTIPQITVDTNRNHFFTREQNYQTRLLSGIFCSITMLSKISSPALLFTSQACKMRWTGHVARMRGVYRVLEGKPEGKRPLGRSRRRWEDDIKMNLQEVGCGGVDWIELARDGDRWRALVTAVMNLRVQ